MIGNMEYSDILFFIFAFITILSASLVVFSNRLTHAVFALLFTFFGVAGLYVFLGADFLAGAQVLIYVGGILVLLIFGVMLTNRIYDLNILAERVQFVPSVLVVGAGFAILITVIYKTPWPLIEVNPPQATTSRIGNLLMTDYLLPFEVVSVLLLAALIGAAMLARGEDREEEEK